MELDHVRAFLVLCEELHFGRTAKRLYLSQPRVSRLIAGLESEIGAALFDRTNRRVELTPLGAEFETRLRPAYDGLLDARDAAHRAATKTGGTLRIGFTITTEGPGLTRLADTFARRHPESTISLTEVNLAAPFDELRSGGVDVVYNWLAVDGSDLACSAPIEQHTRALAMSRNDPLAKHKTVRTKQLAGRRVPVFGGWQPHAIQELFYPPPVLSEAVRRTRAEPSDSPYRPHTMGETWTLVARGQAVHATVASMAAKLARDDIVLKPITDLPPVPLGLIWKRTNENARIRALADAGKSLRRGQAASKP